MVPLVVVSRNRGGAYVLCELDGTVLHCPIAGFRLMPYLARASIPLPENFVDISKRRLTELAESREDGEEEDEPRNALEELRGAGSSPSSSDDEV